VDQRNYHLFQPLLYQVATASLSRQALITHRTSAKDASSDGPIEGSETATMFEQNMMRDETSDAVSRTRNFGDASHDRPRSNQDPS
jgi:hypothetical protein